MKTFSLPSFGTLAFKAERALERYTKDDNVVSSGIIAGTYPYKTYKIEKHQNKSIWSDFRNIFITSTDIAKILNLSRYSNTKEVLLTKLGYIKKEQSLPTVIGVETEAIAAKLYCYYPPVEGKGSVDQFLHNYSNNIKIRDIAREEYFYIVEITLNFMDSLKILVTPDYYETDTKLPVEIKTINEFSFNKYDDEKPNYDYIFQSLFQQLVYGVESGYLFYVISNYNLHKKRVDRVTYEKDLIDAIPVLCEFYNNWNEILRRNLPFEEVVRNYYVNPEFNVDKTPKYKEWLEKLKSKLPEDETPVPVEDKTENDMVEDMLQRYVEMNNHKLQVEKECEGIKNTIRQLYFGKKKIQTELLEISLHPFKVKIKENKT